MNPGLLFDQKSSKPLKIEEAFAIVERKVGDLTIENEFLKKLDGACKKDRQ